MKLCSWLANLFKPKQKIVTIKAITTTRYLHGVFPIQEAVNALPYWHAAMPSHYDKGGCPVSNSPSNQSATVKTCAGIAPLLRKGFIIPAWEDISIVVHPDKTVTCVTPSNKRLAMGIHESNQTPPHFKDYLVLKFVSPWYFYSSEKLEYLLLPAAYHNGLGVDYFMPHGVDEYYYQHCTNFFLAAKPRSEPYEIFIKAGDPLVHIIPLADRDIKFNFEFSHEPDHVPLTSTSFFFMHRHHKLKNIMMRKGNIGNEVVGVDK